MSFVAHGPLFHVKTAANNDVFRPAAHVIEDMMSNELSDGH